jgi:hypothetical protein
MNAANPYQPDDLGRRRPRRSLVVIVSAGLGSILALLVLNLTARPPRSEPASEIELTPAAQPLQTVTTVPITSAPITTIPRTTAFVAPVATLSAPPPTVAPLPAGAMPPSLTTRWFPPDTPDYVRAAIADTETLDVVATVGDGSTAYFAVSALRRTACAGSVYRMTQGSPRELVDSAGFLFPRGDGRWLAITKVTGNDCRPVVVTVVDAANATAREMPAAGWFSAWSTAHARFVMYDYLIGLFTLYDAPSLTSLGLGIAPSFAQALDAQVGPRPADRPGWVMGRVAFLPEGDLVAHIQCMPDACIKSDTITGWFYVVDGQIADESARVPLDKAPPFSNFCGV